MRKYLNYLTALATLTAVFNSQAGVLPAQSPSESETLNNRITVDELDRDRSVEYFDSPFGDIIDELNELTGLRILIHETAIDNNLDLDTPVTFKLESTRLATILDVILERYQCTYSIRDGIVVIVSEDYALENPTLELINCSPLLAKIQPRTEFVDGKKPATVEPPKKIEGKGLGGGVFLVPSLNGTSELQHQEAAATQETPSSTETPASASEIEVEVVTDAESGGYYRVFTPEEQLVRMIREMIDPDSWLENGGHCRVIEINGILVIRQTEHNIREIRALVERLSANGMD